MLQSFFTFDIVPPITREFLLIKQGSIGTQKFRALFPFPPIMAYVVSLKKILDQQ